MNLYKITFTGTAYIRADSVLDAEERFGDGDYINQTIDVDGVTEVEGVDEDG